MTVVDALITAASNLLTGLTVYFIKDKKAADASLKRSDLDYFQDLVKTLKEDNKELTGMLKAEKADRESETKLKDECLETVHKMEIAAQKKDNEITALKIIKNNNTNNY